MALPKYDISIPWFAYICRDVLPFTLELPEAIAKASSHKQLESISHMGVGRYKTHSLLNLIAGLKEAVLLGMVDHCLLYTVSLYCAKKG